MFELIDQDHDFELAGCDVTFRRIGAMSWFVSGAGSPRERLSEVFSPPRNSEKTYLAVRANGDKRTDLEWPDGLCRMLGLL